MPVPPSPSTPVTSNFPPMTRPELSGGADARIAFGVSTPLICGEILSSRAHARVSDLRRDVDRVERDVRLDERAMDRRELRARELGAREEPIAAADGLDPAPRAHVREEQRD